jgi:hypothetical protein
MLLSEIPAVKGISQCVFILRVYYLFYYVASDRSSVAEFIIIQRARSIKRASYNGLTTAYIIFHISRIEFAESADLKSPRSMSLAFLGLKM